MRNYTSFFALGILIILILMQAGCGGSSSSKDSITGAVISSNVITGQIFMPEAEAFASIAYASESRLSASGTPVQNAIVWLEQLPELQPIITDESGYFEFSNLSGKNYAVIARYQAGPQTFMVREEVEARSLHETPQASGFVLEPAGKKVQVVLKDSSGTALPYGTRVVIWGEQYYIDDNGIIETGNFPDSLGIAEALINLPGSGTDGWVNTLLPLVTESFAGIVELELGEVNSQFRPIGMGIEFRQNNVELTSNSRLSPGDRVALTLKLFQVETSEAGLELAWNCTDGSFDSTGNNDLSPEWVAPEYETLATISATLSVPSRGKVTASVVFSVGDPEPVGWRVSFEPGNGKSIDPVVVGDGELISEPEPPTFDGHRFIGWFVSHQSNQPWNFATDKIIEDITLYARWEPESVEVFTITYVGNGYDSGSPPRDNSEYSEGSQVTIMGNTDELTRQGFAFAGWNTAADGTGEQYMPGDMLVVEAQNIELYAVWSPLPTYSVTYHGNGHASGTPPQDVSEYLEGSQVVIMGNNGALARLGFSFAGWNTAADGTGVAYEPGDALVVETKDLEFYAIWLVSPAPAIVSLVPDDKTYGIATSSSFEIHFDQNVVKNQGRINFYGFNNMLLASVDVNSDQVVVEGNKAAIKPEDPLADDVFHYITIDSGVLVNAHGSEFAGISDASRWRFKTMFEYAGQFEAPNDIPYWNLKKINAPEAWKYSTGEGVLVAVLDSGIDLSHPAFANKIVEAVNYTDSPFGAQDRGGHGTHVAGIIAANGPWVGSAPKANLLVAKVLNDEGFGDHNNIIDGIIWAIDSGATILNLSLESKHFNPVHEEAINFAWNRGALVVSVTGNDGVTPVEYPGRYGNAIAVGATDRNDNLWVSLDPPGGSNYGPEVLFTAPGQDVVSLVPEGFPVEDMRKSGTSMAAPHVSGLAALIWAKNPDFTPMQVFEAMVYGAVDLGAPGHDQYFGYGRIDALKSLQYVPGDLPASVMASRASVSEPVARQSEFAASEYVKGQLFVKIKAGSRLNDAIDSAELSADQIKVIKEYRIPGLKLLTVPEGEEVTYGRALQATEHVIYAELNEILSRQ